MLCCCMCKSLDFKNNLVLPKVSKYTFMFSKEFRLMYAALIWAKSGILGFTESQHLGTLYPGRWQVLLSE